MEDVTARGEIGTRNQSIPVPLREGQAGGERTAVSECLGLATKPLMPPRKARNVPNQRGEPIFSSRCDGRQYQHVVYGKVKIIDPPQAGFSRRTDSSQLVCFCGARLRIFAHAPRPLVCTGGILSYVFCHVRSMKVVSTWPSMNADWLKISRCRGMVVLTPSTTNSARARRMHARASGRVGW